MLFSLFDVILILAVFGFTLFGLWFGLVHTFGALVGTVIAAMIAGTYYTVAPGTVPQVIAFIVIFIIVSRLIGLIFYLVNRVFNLFTIIPFLKSINRLLGGVFGLLEGLLVVGVVLIVASRFDLGPWFVTAMTNSKTAPPIVGFASILLPVLPEALRRLQSLIPWVKF